jgi:hypothetical protein
METLHDRNNNNIFWVLAAVNIVAYLRKVKIVELEKQPLLGNGYETRNNGITVRSSSFSAVRAGTI